MPKTTEVLVTSSEARLRHDVVRLSFPFTAFCRVLGTDASITTGLPDFSRPVRIFRACNLKLLPDAVFCSETTYIVLVLRSMAGVAVMPIHGLGLPPDNGVSPAARREVCQ